MKKLFIILFIINLNISYAKSLEADVFVQSTVNRASDVLSKNISKEEKINGLKMIAKETVDIKGVGFYSLGSFRKNLDNTQKKKYLYLFENYFLKVFLVDYLNIRIRKLT